MNLGTARSHTTVLHPVGLCFRKLNWNRAVENGWVRERAKKGFLLLLDRHSRRLGSL